MQCNVLCLQETHKDIDRDLPKIYGIILAVERPNRQYGSAIFVRTGATTETTSNMEERNIELLTVELNIVIVTSVYKPHQVNFYTTTTQAADYHW